MNVSAVSPEDALSVVAEVAPQVMEAMQSGQGDAHTPEDALQAVTSGRQQLWAIHDDDTVHAVAGVSVDQYSACRKVFVSLLAGRRMFEWADKLEAALQRCREVTGSRCVEASCRPELARYLERRGWRVKAVIMEAPE